MRLILSFTTAAVMTSALTAAQPPDAPTNGEAAPEAVPAEAAAAKGVLPIPDYSGNFWIRKAVLGDLGGARTDLAEFGIQFGIDWNNTLQSVVSGGRDNTTKYGGTLDYNLTFDLMRMGLLPGALVRLRGESRYGESVNTDAGPLLPVNSDFLFPITSEVDESVPFALTTLSYTQFFSESFAIYFGKFDTLDGDPNEFASGRGLTQFQNLNLIFNASPLVTVPYSTLGGGLVWKPHPFITLSSSVVTTADSSTTTGFNRIGDGWTWASEAQVQYRLGHLPGGFNVGGAYAWDNDFTTIGRRFVFRPGEGISPAPDEDSSWAMYVSAWQYIFAEEPADGGKAPLNPADGAPDRKGFGLFARLGFADEETNPLEFSVSGGVGGRGVIPGRDNDLFGVGFFHSEVQTRRLTSLLGVDDAYDGFEAFYNIAITPAAGLTS